jgi:uncharacterized membrane protein (UPF0127 family)
MRRPVALALLLSLCACAHSSKVTSIRFVSQTRSAAFTVEVARTPAEQQRGLMSRSSLPRDRGMLFVWRAPEVRRFWMKDTLIPLDLISIRNGRVVGIAHMTPCLAEPCPLTATPSADAALEVGGGVAAARGVEVGALAESPALS